MANLFNRGKNELGETVFSGRDFRMLLLRTTVAYTYDADDNFVADVLTGGVLEVSVAGYARQTLASVAVTENDTLDRVEYEADQATFASLVAGQTIDAAVVFIQVTNDADSVLVSYYNLVDTPTNGGNVNIQFDGSDPGDFLRILNN